MDNAAQRFNFHSLKTMVDKRQRHFLNKMNRARAMLLVTTLHRLTETARRRYMAGGH
jgi:hypothetical protein